MKVAIDIDGVIARWSERFIEFTNTLYNRNNNAEDITTWEFWTLDEIEMTKEEFLRGQDLFCQYRMWQTIETFEYATDALTAIDADGFDIYYLTSRPKGSERATLKFILKNGIPFGNGLIFCKSNEKAHIAGQLGVSVAIDDNVDTINSYVKAGIRSVALLHRYNMKYLLNSYCSTVNNLKEFHSYLLSYRKNPVK